MAQAELQPLEKDMDNLPACLSFTRFRENNRHLLTLSENFTSFSRLLAPGTHWVFGLGILDEFRTRLAHVLLLCRPRVGRN